MITNLFKNNLLSYILVLIIGILYWGFEYVNLAQIVQEEIKIGEFSFNLSNQNSILISFFVTFLGGLFLNFKIKKHLLSYNPNNLFLLFYVVLISTQLSNSNVLLFSFVSLSIVFLANYLLYFIQDKDDEKQIFNASLLLGILIFHNPILGFFVFILIQSLSSIRRISMKEIILTTVGILLPIAYVMMITYLVDNTSVNLVKINFEFEFPKISWKYAVVLILLLYLCVVGFNIVMRKRSGTDIKTLRLNKNLFAFLIASIVISFVSLFSFSTSYTLYILAIPISIFLGFYFANSTFKRKELLFLICIGATFLLR